jgi:hypothetical protein
MTKAITDFSGYSGPELVVTSQTIHDALVPIAAQYPNLPVALPAFQDLIDICNTALQKKASRAIADTAAFNVARANLEDALSRNGGYINVTVNGDETKIIATGYPFYETGNTADYSPPEAPTNMVVRQGDLSGEAVARFHPKRDRSLNEVQKCEGDPNAEVNWKMVGMFSGGRATIPGIIPGTAIWVRARTAGLQGVMGAWSDAVKIIVT